jgi:hypothetical protein
MAWMQFLLLFLMSSLAIYLFAQPAEMSIAANETITQANLLCEKYKNYKDKNFAQSLYNKAFILSLTGQWEKAKGFSAEAAYLTNGSTHWAHE